MVQNTVQGVQISNIVIKMLISSAKKLALPIEGLLQQLPQDIIKGSDESTRYLIDNIAIIWDWFSQHSNDENIGFRMAQAVPLTSQSILTFLFMTSKTLGDGIEKMLTYQQVFAAGGEISLQVQNDECTLSFQLNKDPQQKIRQQSECFTLLIHDWITDLLAGVWQLKQLHYSHAAPGNIKEHKKLFNCELVFSASVNAFVFDSSLLARPLRYANLSINQLHEQQAQQILTQIEDAKLTDNIMSLISANLTAGDIHIQAIAEQYQLSERQLKSKLEHKGTSFSELLDEVRKRKAITLLSNSEKSIAEIADSCGFSDPSVFNRAFKRWFDKTPSKYRKELIAELS